MAGERLSAGPEKKGIVPKFAKEGVLWVAEKSTWVTVPLTIVAVLAGSIALTTGVVFGAVDVGTSRWAGNKRKKLQGK